MERFSKVSRVCGRALDPQCVGTVWVRMDSIDGLLFSGFVTPRHPVSQKENLFLGEVCKTRQQQISASLLVLTPCLEGCYHAAGISNVLAQCQLSIDGNWTVLGRDCVVLVLFDKALALALKGRESRVVPPVCKITILIITGSRGVKSV